MPLFDKKNSAANQVGKPTKENSHSPQEIAGIIDVFLGPLLVEEPVLFASAGAIKRQHALAVWAWLSRDINKHLTGQALEIFSSENNGQSLARLAVLVADLIASTQKITHDNPEATRRLQIQLGGEGVYESLGIIESAFRNYQLLEKAVAYGQAINGVTDENSLKLALQTFPLDEPGVSELIMHAAIGQVINPIRLICSVTDLSDGETQRAVTKAGFAPIIEALLAHAQNQMHLFATDSVRFQDIDLICRSVGRYHRLIRAISNVTENDKSCEWSRMVATIVRHMSELIEPRLNKVDSDIRQSLRKPRTGPDIIDSNLMLDALNGLYLLASVREALDSLALNSIVNRLWGDVGKSLEVLIERNLDSFRNSPDSEMVAKRLDIGITMAKVRFNPEYAGIISRARDGAFRRAAS